MITSHRNPLIKRIRKLRRKKYRRREGAFFVEGIRVVLSALEQGAPLETIVHAPDLLTSDVARQMLAEQGRRGAHVVAVSGQVFEAISDRDNPVGLGAIIGVRTQTLAELPQAKAGIYVALDSISDPGNLGTIVRTVDGAGATALILAGQSTDPFHPTAVKASMGALFTVPVAEVDDLQAVWPWAEQRGLHTIATSAGARQSYWRAGYRLPALLILGSEGEGLPEEVLSQAELTVKIPMHGTSSSLNVAVAAGLLLYELRRNPPHY
jgi:TrmH family RNA methyltransferase